MILKDSFCFLYAFSGTIGGGYVLNGTSLEKTSPKRK